MFGFLRRKKPVESPAAAPPDSPAAAPPDSPAAAPPDSPAAAPPLDARSAAARPADVGPVEAAGAFGEAPPAAADPMRADAVQAEAMAPQVATAWPELEPEPHAEPATEAGAGAASAAPAAGPSASAADVSPDRKPWLARLKQGLSRTRSNLTGLFVGVKVDEALFDELETALLTSDAGVDTTQWLLAALRERVRRERITDGQQVKAALRQVIAELLAPLERPVDIDRAVPLVVMIAGVNGAGKTTSIGKLARHLRREGKSVLLAAGDTFRAAAREQLAQWGSRNDVEVIAQHGGDPAAVAFDAVSAGRARRTGVVMVDTAGRLPTQTHLMEELRKVRRVIGKAMEGAPHEVLLVLDGNTGQNMLAQVRAFDDAVQLTGLIVTKLDGTAKGGALVALAHTRRERPIPVYFIGVGEGIDDLQAFSADEFAGALLD
jgi:fused signal recognition particle receptor